MSTQQFGQDQDYWKKFCSVRHDYLKALAETVEQSFIPRASVNCFSDITTCDPIVTDHYCETTDLCSEPFSLDALLGDCPNLCVRRRSGGARGRFVIDVTSSAQLSALRFGPSASDLRVPYQNEVNLLL